MKAPRAWALGSVGYVAGAEASRRNATHNLGAGSRSDFHQATIGAPLNIPVLVRIWQGCGVSSMRTTGSAVSHGRLGKWPVAIEFAWSRYTTIPLLHLGAAHGAA